jgi:hypothetical protein
MSVTTAINVSGSLVRGGGFRDQAAPVEVGKGCERRGRVKGQPQGSLGRLYRARKAREGDGQGYNVH